MQKHLERNPEGLLSGIIFHSLEFGLSVIISLFSHACFVNNFTDFIRRYKILPINLIEINIRYEFPSKGLSKDINFSMPRILFKSSDSHTTIFILVLY